MTQKTCNVLIGGEAGQGLVTVGQILAKGLVRSGYAICVTQSYQSRIRGGHNTFAIRAGVNAVKAPQEAVDLLVALDADTVHIHKDEVSPEGLIIIDEALAQTGAGVLPIPFKTLASDQYTNIVALGVIAALLGLDQGIVAQTVVDFFGKGHPDAVQENQRVLGASYRWAVEQHVAFTQLPPAGQSGAAIDDERERGHCPGCRDGRVKILLLLSHDPLDLHRPGPGRVGEGDWA